MEHVYADFDALQLRDVAVHGKQDFFCFEAILIAVVLQFKTNYVLDHIFDLRMIDFYEVTMEIYENNGDLIVMLPFDFDLAQTLDCGQAFRWEIENDDIWSGVIKKRVVKVKQEDRKLRFYDTNRDYFNTVLSGYFDFDRDYETIKEKLREDKDLNAAIDYCGGIRILRQEPWETLCSFIISQNNNIPRIKGIITRLCENFGEKIEKNEYSFPSAETLAYLSPDDLAPLRAGFRNKYIIDAAKKVSAGTVSFDLINNSDLETGRAELQKISGVGPKVAECALLYGFGKIDAFPIDVWVKRILSETYPDGLPACTDGVRGIAQQFLFHYRRSN